MSPLLLMTLPVRSWILLPSCLVPPEIFEPLGAESSVNASVRNVPVPQVALDGPRVHAVVCQLVPGSVPEHVWVYREFQSRFHAGPGNHLANRARRQRSPPLAREHIRRFRVVPLKLT